MRVPVMIGTLTATLTTGLLLATPSQAADFGALRNCADPGDTATVLYAEVVISASSSSSSGKG